MENSTLNKQPTKISGQYKIVLGIDNQLYLDDYTSRRVAIDLSLPFLPQVGNFLLTKTKISDYSILKYGAFNRKVKSFHIPLYVSNKNFPKYFVISKVENKQFDIPSDIYKNNRIVKLIDFSRHNIDAIFEEIYQFNCRPTFFNPEDSFIKIEGYDINNLSKGNKTLSITSWLANQNKFGVVNNKIMNAFKDNDLIIPNFLGIEVEFEDDSSDYTFQNYFGFISDKHESGNIMVNIYDGNKFRWEQLTNRIEPVPYDDLLTSVTVKRLANQDFQSRFSITNISAEDYIRIIHPDGSLYFEYYVTPEDIKSTFTETVRLLCAKMQVVSNQSIRFKNETTKNLSIITVIINETTPGFILDVPRIFKILDQKEFKGISNKELQFLSNVDIEVSKINIGNIDYQITDKFKFNGVNIISLNKEPNITYSVGDFYVRKYSEIIYLKPIPFQTTNSIVKSSKQYEKDKYVQELTDRFVLNRTDKTHIRYDEFVEVSQKAIDSFTNKNNEPMQYTKDVEVESLYTTKTVEQESNELDSLKQHNTDEIRTMMFLDYGTTSYITPNILNIDKQFYGDNGNLDYIRLDADKYKFNWFLIKGEAPKYLSESLRYFTDSPKITTKLLRNGNYVETTFLGVKYRLPLKYENYDFAVYLDFTNEERFEVSYEFKIENNKLYLIIYKYLDFIDLIRGGNIDQTPLLDLSLLYNVQESHNSLSEALFSFKSGGIMICDTEIPVRFNSNVIYDWKVQYRGKWYICLKRSNSVITSSFDEIFPTSGNFDFYVYSTAIIDGQKVNYVSMKFTVENIILVDKNYIWVEDLKVKFFDTYNLVLDVNDELIKVDPEKIVSIVPYDAPLYKFESIITILYDSIQVPFKIIAPEREFSIKEYYFEFGKKLEFSPIHQTPTETNHLFIFPEYFDPESTYDDFVRKFGETTFDSVTPNQTLNLFNRNQIWKVIQDIIKTDVRFKHSSAKQTKRIIDELLLNNLVDYSDLQTVPTNIEDERIKLTVVPNDNNLAIWKEYSEFKTPEDRVFKINRYKGYYYSGLFDTTESEFQDYDTPRLFNIYDNDFNGKNISATGNWSEVHNIVSSIFTKTDDIIIQDKFSTEYNFYDMLQKQIVVPVINSKNENVLNWTGNIDSYLKELFVKYLLDKFYYIAEVKNELNQKLNFEQSEYNLKLTNPGNTRFNNIIIVFKRK